RPHYILSLSPRSWLVPRAVLHGPIAQSTAVTIRARHSSTLAIQCRASGSIPRTVRRLPGPWWRAGAHRWRSCPGRARLQGREESGCQAASVSGSIRGETGRERFANAASEELAEPTLSLPV